MIAGWLTAVLLYVLLIVTDSNYKRILLIRTLKLTFYIYYRKVWNKIVFKTVTCTLA